MLADLIALSDNSRVWLYQADRVLSDEEKDEMKVAIFDFVKQWTAHSKDLLAYGNIFHNRVLGLFVDETLMGASGCSIDSSVKFVTQLGNHFNVDFFNRMLFSYLIDETIYTVTQPELKALYANGTIHDKTLMFDNLVKNKGDFLTSWLKPLEESWVKRFV